MLCGCLLQQGSQRCSRAGPPQSWSLVRAAAEVMQIVAVLHHGKSSYLAPFLSLRDIIMKEAAVAEDNLKFLHCLEEPCQLLAKSSPQASALALLCALWSLQLACVMRFATECG